MPKINEIVAFLQEIGQVEAVHNPSEHMMDLELKGVRTDQEAGKGDLSWLSVKTFNKDSSRYFRFKGSLLICSQDVLTETPPASAVTVATTNPRLAFIRAASQFFSQLYTTTWPKLNESPISSDAKIHSSVEISHGVVIGSGVEIGEGSYIGPNTCIANCTIGKNVFVGANCSIGVTGFGFEADDEGHYWRFPHFARVVIHDAVEIDSNVCIDQGALGDTVIGKLTKISDQCHIGHNSRIGEDCLVIAHTVVSGSVRVGNNVWLAPGSQLLNNIAIGDGARVSLGSCVFNDVPPGITVIGNPARSMQWNKK